MKSRKSYLLTYLPIVRFCWETERDKKKLSEKTYLLTYLPCIPFGSQAQIIERKKLTSLHTYPAYLLDPELRYSREKKLSRENTYLLTYLPYSPFGSQAQRNLENKSQDKS